MFSFFEFALPNAVVFANSKTGADAHVLVVFEFAIPNVVVCQLYCKFKKNTWLCLCVLQLPNVVVCKLYGYLIQATSTIVSTHVVVF